MKRYGFLLWLVLGIGTLAWAEIRITPDEPTTSNEIYVTVSFQAPTGGYGIDNVTVQRQGRQFWVDVYLHGAAPGAMVTQATQLHEHTESLGRLGSGQYTVHVTYRGVELPDDSVSFNVSPSGHDPDGGGSPGGSGEPAWYQLDYPGAINTFALGVDGTNIVGYFTDQQGRDRGYLYDGSTWTALHYPGADLTRFIDIDGANMVGMYRKNGKAGVLYDGTDWHVMSVGNSADTIAYGIDGTNIVGAFADGGYRGFLYDGTTYSVLDYPGDGGTWAVGIDGSNIVGWGGPFNPGIPRYAFLYDGTTWTRLEYPGAARTWAWDIDGSNIVGNFEEEFRGGAMHGFLYDGTTWTQLDYPGTMSTTQARGIDGNRIVGEFIDADGVIHAFLYVGPLPVPSTAGGDEDDMGDQVDPDPGPGADPSPEPPTIVDPPPEPEAEPEPDFGTPAWFEWWRQERTPVSPADPADGLPGFDVVHKPWSDVSTLEEGISQVSITPAQPTSEDDVVATVSGWKTDSRYEVDDTHVQRTGSTVRLDIYWHLRPTPTPTVGNSAGHSSQQGLGTIDQLQDTTVTLYDVPHFEGAPYQVTESLGTFSAGVYTLYVTNHGEVPGSASMTFTVKAFGADLGLDPTPPSWWSSFRSGSSAGARNMLAQPEPEPEPRIVSQSSR